MSANAPAPPPPPAPPPHSAVTFRLAGIQVDVPLSGILGVGLLAVLWAPAFADPDVDIPYFVIAVVFALLLSAATLVHEFAHALTARALGFQVRRVVLQLLGGVTYFERAADKPWREAAVAASGPVATFAVAGGSALVARWVPHGGMAWTVAWALTWANLVMGAYNSLPGLPLDGGAVLRCVIWGITGSERAGVMVAAGVGRGLAVATALLPFALSYYFGWGAPEALVVFLAIFLALTLWQGAGAQLAALELRTKAADLSAAALARRAIPVPGDLPLAEAIRRAGQVGAAALVVTDSQGRPVALGSAQAIAAMPEERRPWVSMAAVARQIDDEAILPVDLAGEELLRQVIVRRRGEYLVVDEAGRVYGVLQTSDLEGQLRK